MAYNLRLERGYQTGDYTPGTLLAGGHVFFTCEDIEREVAGKPVNEWKIMGRTAIPRGRYRVILSLSQRFKKVLPLLLDVPGFTGIRIHAGNTAADTDGCILVGMERGMGGVLKSRDAMDKLQGMIAAALSRGEEVWLEIV